MIPMRNTEKFEAFTGHKETHPRHWHVAFGAVGVLVLLSLWSGLSEASPKFDRFPVTVDPSQEEFSLIVVPDTQRYTAFFPQILWSQFHWIREFSERLNVQYVVHLGDIVETGAEPEWTLVDQAFSLLDGRVPYLAVPGNHDLEATAKSVGRRDSTRFNAVFSPKRFLNYRWYGGHMGVTGDNSFGYFHAGGQQFLVLGLEFGPSDEALAWAELVVRKNTHKVILVTHCYMYDDNTRVGVGDQNNPHRINPLWNDGEQIWEKLVRKNGRFVLVLSGHIKGRGTGRLISQTDAGTPVLQMLSNYQHLEHGGQGWLRILKFLPREKKLEVFTYSPWLDRFREEEDQQFTVEIPWIFP